MKIPTELDIARLIEDEEELRKIAPTDGAMGKNGSDYKNMYNMFLRLFQDASALRADPKAFLTPSGAYNDKIINAYAKLMGLAMKGMEALNKMRNNDRMVSAILESNARDLSQAACIELGVELKAIIQAIDSGLSSDEAIIQLRRLLHKRVPEIFLKSASTTLLATREAYGLLN